MSYILIAFWSLIALIVIAIGGSVALVLIVLYFSEFDDGIVLQPTTEL